MQVDKEEITLSTDDVFQAYRYYLGILEGPEIHNHLPFAVNLDWMHALSLTKGCYLGQELTARSYHRGIIRRRVFGIMVNGLEVDRTFDADLTGMEVTNAHGVKLGKILASKWNVAVCLLKYLDSEWWNDLNVGNLTAKVIRKNDRKL